MKILIAIPTYQRPELLKNLLEKLCDIELQPEIELKLIIIDNSNLELNKKLVTQIKLPFKADYIAHDKNGVVHSRNLALQMAKQYDALCFLDDDDYPQPDWLIKLLIEYKNSRADIILGMRKFFLADNSTSWYRHNIFQEVTKFSKPKIRKKYGLRVQKGGTGNILIGQRILQADLIFDQRFNFIGSEDLDFFIRAEQQGFKISYALDSVVNCLIRAEETSKAGYRRRAKQFGNSLSHLLAKHAKYHIFIFFHLQNILAWFLTMLAFLFWPILSTRKRAKISFKCSKYLGSISALFNMKTNLYKR